MPHVDIGSRDSYSSPSGPFTRTYSSLKSYHSFIVLHKLQLIQKTFPNSYKPNLISPFQRKLVDLMVFVAKFIHLLVSEILSTYWMQSVKTGIENAKLSQP